MGQAPQPLSPRRQQALAELRAWRERMTDSDLIKAADLVIAMWERGDADEDVID
jgi:hypothetical protein